MDYTRCQICGEWIESRISDSEAVMRKHLSRHARLGEVTPIDRVAEEMEWRKANA